MTLTLDEVRNTKFHMARRSGYEVTDVDLFVDRVEASFGQLVEENENLKREIESLKKPGGQGSPSGPAEAGAADDGEKAALKARIAELEKQVDEARTRPAPQPAAAPAAPSSPALSAPEGDRQPTGTPENIVVTTSAEASPAVVRLVQLATEQAERLVSEAKADSERSVDEAKRQAHEITTDARTRAEHIETEARTNADKVRGDAQAHADNLKREVEGRRGELFGQLEGERDRLADSVAKLRSFEETYRGNLTTHLRRQIEQIESGRFEPEEQPDALNPQKPNEQQSETPRLDALLKEQR